MTDVNLPKEHADFADAGLALLGFASGNMDALAFFNLGQVFPSAMTGNTALLGLALGQGDVIAALRPLIAFAVGRGSPSCHLWPLPGRRASTTALDNRTGVGHEARHHIWSRHGPAAAPFGHAGRRRH